MKHITARGGGFVVPDLFAGPPRHVLEDSRPPVAVTGSVYYVRRASGDIKIGHTGNLTLRLWQLRREFGPVEVLATEAGGWHEEHRRHDQFAHLRLTPAGEWFRPGADLISHTDSLRGAA